MNEQDMLPMPIGASSEKTDASYQESAASLQTERQPSALAGSAAISAVAVNDAQGQISAAQATALAASTTTTSNASYQHLSADDLDLIEKTWVQKAKDIVRLTHGDPRKQNIELSKMKAEYIKKRYSKEIKVKDN